VEEHPVLDPAPYGLQAVLIPILRARGERAPERQSVFP
jgi:hypothetical protein